MAYKINIMLITALGVTPSWGKSMFDNSNPARTDYYDAVDRFVPELSKPSFAVDIRNKILLQPNEPKINRTYQEHSVVLAFERGQRISRPKYGLNHTPSKKSNGDEPGKQYAWYVEDWLLLAKDTFDDRKGVSGYTNFRRVHRTGALAKFFHSIIRNLNPSIQIVGAHYWIVNSYR